MAKQTVEWVEIQKVGSIYRVTVTVGDEIMTVGDYHSLKTALDSVLAFQEAYKPAKATRDPIVINISTLSTGGEADEN